MACSFGVHIDPARSEPPAESESAPSKSEGKRKKAARTNERLQAIEKELQKIHSDLEELRKRVPAPARPESGQPSETRGTEQKRGSQDTPPPVAPASMKLDPVWMNDVQWRSLGPANMGGRITDVVVHDADPSLWWIATASGGLLKTENHGVTMQHQFDHENTVSIGAIAADSRDRNLLWVGTGEANPRNSVSYGDGVYKSKDGGKTWKHMGLKETFQIGRILINPKDSNIVYVGALGRLYGPSSQRGVFKTVDGGETWEQILYVDDRTGVIDMIMHPKDPQTIIAALWDRQRDAFDSWPGRVPRPDGIDAYDPIRKWGPGGGLYKTTDGGQTWKKLTVGLPSGMTGRIGLDWQKNSPHVIYAIIDCENIGKGPQPSTAYLGLVGKDVDGRAVITQVMPNSPAEKAGIQNGDILLSVDDYALKTFDDLLDIVRKHSPGDELSITTERDGEQQLLTARLTVRPGQKPPASTGVWLGVSGEDQGGRAVLTRVIEDGPAAKAGLKAQDVITAIDGRPVSGYRALIDEIRRRKAGDKLKLTVQRGDTSLDAEVTLENRPGQTQTANPNVYMGIRGQDSEKGGPQLTDITESGPAEKAGLKRGDVVLALGDTKTPDYNALVAAIRSHKAGDKVKVTILRGTERLETELTFADRPGGPTRDRPYLWSYYGQAPNVQDQQGSQGHEYGGVYRSMDAGESWERVNSLNTRPMYFSVIRVDPADPDRVYVLGVAQFQSDDGGLTFTGDFGRGVHADGHDLWIDPKDGRHMVTGGDGGVYATYDRGKNWDHINTMAIGQFYHAAIIPREPYWVVGGLQDNGSWAGPAISRTGGAVNEDWISVGGGDGFVCRVDPHDPDLIYYESQNGGMQRRHLKTGERARIRPQRREGMSYRFNWNTPFILSGHNSGIFYCAGNYVFRSVDRGNNLVPISPEITLTPRGSGTAIAESPLNPDVLYVGTDDGALWVTLDGGQTWQNITNNVGIPSPRWIASIEASRFSPGRVYICMDGHRSDDDQPYLFVSDDFGQTFRSLRANLPWGSTRCLREDLYNENLLYVGTEFAAWVSLDRGAHWLSLNTNLPTVAVHEFAIHPTNGEIVAVTHGRSLWACDVTGLRHLSADHVTKKADLLPPNDVVRWRSEPRRGRTNRRFTAKNPAPGAHFWYVLPADAKQVRLRIEDINGHVVRALNVSGKKGLHHSVWNLVGTSAPARTEKPDAPQSNSQASRPVPNGTYRVALVVDGKDVSRQTVNILRDPTAPRDAVSEEEIEQDAIEEERAIDAKIDAKRHGHRVRTDD